jgi:hypothetical protein
MPESLEKMHADFLTGAINETAAGLRRLAERVEHGATDVPLVGTGPGRNTYAAIASHVIHEVTWGIANLSMERLARESAAADVARAKGE